MITDSPYNLTPIQIREELDLQWKDEIKDTYTYTPHVEYDPLRELDYRFE